MRKKKNNIVKKKFTVEKDVMVDDLGKEDTKTLKGASFNRPITMLGFIIFLGGPILGGLTENIIIGGILFTVGGIIMVVGGQNKA